MFSILGYLCFYVFITIIRLWLAHVFKNKDEFITFKKKEGFTQTAYIHRLWVEEDTCSYRKASKSVES
jgi:hypothetical protein